MNVLNAVHSSEFVAKLAGQFWKTTKIDHHNDRIFGFATHQQHFPMHTPKYGRRVDIARGRSSITWHSGSCWCAIGVDTFGQRSVDHIEQVLIAVGFVGQCGLQLIVADGAVLQDISRFENTLQCALVTRRVSKRPVLMML
jgi:hypothetical protein